MKLKISHIMTFVLMMSFAFVANNASAQGTLDDDVIINPRADGEVRTGNIAPPPPGSFKPRAGNSSVINTPKKPIGNADYPKDVSDGPKIFMKRATTTELFRKNVGHKPEIKKNMEVVAFRNRFEALVKELSVGLNNLTNIRSRIAERITRLEAEGRVMTEAKKSLVIADAKLAVAKTSINAFIALNTSTGTSTAQVDLVKPRTLGDAAIKELKEAKKALQETTRLLAPGQVKMNMGSTTVSSPVNQ